MYGYIHMKSNVDLCAAERRNEIDRAWRRAVRLDRVAEQLIGIASSANSTAADYDAAKSAADAAQSAHDDWAILAGVRSSSLFV